MVPRKGLEPSRPLSHWHLKPARLPIPPPGPGPVSTDRSRACQIGSSPAKCAVQRRPVGVSRNGVIPCDLSTLTKGKWTPWHRIWTRWSRFSEDPAFSAAAWSGRWPSAITGSGSRCGGRNWPGICSRSARSARSTPCRPICATRPRSRPRCGIPTSPSTWSASWPRAAPRPSTRCRAQGAGAIAGAANAAGARMVHVSAIGADENSPSRYGRSKAAGEKAVLAAVPSATILRPSVVFGPEDQFTNRFAGLATISPVLPLIGGGVTKTAAGLCRRRRDRGGGCRRRQDEARRDVRTRRSGSADHARGDRNHSRHHRTPAHAGVAAVRARQIARRCSCSSRRGR